MLDIGCGGGHFRSTFVHCGFDYIGIDLIDDDATILADARALPFGSECFEFVWSNAVLQYVSHPDIALAEIYRVMKPGGKFMGSLGFLETFDGNNMHLTTGLGALRYFSEAGFEIYGVAPDDRWTGPMAIGAAMFPGLPKKLLYTLVTLGNALSQLYWHIGSVLRPQVHSEDRLIKITGGFEFILRKPSR